jgi:hypothetical protein
VQDETAGVVVCGTCWRTGPPPPERGGAHRDPAGRGTSSRLVPTRDEPGARDASATAQRSTVAPDDARYVARRRPRGGPLLGDDRCAVAWPAAAPSGPDSASPGSDAAVVGIPARREAAAACSEPKAAGTGGAPSAAADRSSTSAGRGPLVAARLKARGTSRRRSGSRGRDGSRRDEAASCRARDESTTASRVATADRRGGRSECRRARRRASG